MRRRPPRSTRTDTLFPYTTLFRSLTDLVGGQTSYMFAILPESMPLVKSGQLRALAVTTSKRLPRSEEHTSELQSLMRISYAVFCLKKKKTTKYTQHNTRQNLRQHNYTQISNT